MRAVVQRVTQARVLVDGRVTGEIGRGLLALVAVATGDTRADAAWIAGKLSELRVFPDEHRSMNRDVSEAGGGILLVSQFTLLGDARRGRRPGFTEAAPPETAEPLVAAIVDEIRGRGIPVEEGEFRAHMDVELTNDGPVTILLDSRKTF